MIEQVAGTEKAFKLVDKNGDGHISGADIPFAPGSIEAKKAWLEIDKQAHSPEMVKKAKAMGYEKATGMYMGKPLVPGEGGQGQGDLKFWKDKLIMHNGFSSEVANKLIDKAIQQAKQGR